MKSNNHIVLSLLALVVIAGCGSTKVTSRNELVTGLIPRPAHIWVYDFAATPADVPAESALAGKYSEHSAPQTAEQIATGRKLGAEIAAELVKEIRGMGMPAEQAVAATTPQINDIVIRGYLISFKKGSEAKRFAIGFGSGASDLKVAVEGFQMTAQGLRKLGSGTAESGGSKAPGADLGVLGLIATHNPAGLIISSGMKVYGEESGSSKVEGRAEAIAKEIADVLKKRFQEQGWIS
ncbi:MAG: DUF4410 domain-containing protein [Deltaproteobacteria bacterium]|jgi:hypothetical protein